MYGKIFESMYDGSLYGQWEAIITFQQMIVLSDKDGFVDITPPALSARTSIPLEIITKGIEILENEDPYSRTEGDDGRRIVLIDERRPWGWQIVNHKKYRDMVTQEERREYMKEYMRKKRKQEKEDSELTDVNSKQSLAELTHTDTDINTDTNKEQQAKACSFELKMKQYFDDTILSCEKITALAKVYNHKAPTKPFNPYQWVQEKVNKEFHPGAIVETLQALIPNFLTINKHYGYANKIIATKNGNWNEKDHIEKHEKEKFASVINEELKSKIAEIGVRINKE